MSPEDLAQLEAVRARIRAKLDAARAMLDASKARLTARGFDADAIVGRATANLQYWRAHPAEWDAVAVASASACEEID